MKLFAHLCACAFVMGLTPPALCSETAPPSAVKRSEVLAMADQYNRHVWIPSERNIMHAVDAAGIRVNTPNAGYAPEEGRPGWWQPGKPNIGIPYMWGGFDTPETFDRG